MKSWREEAKDTLHHLISLEEKGIPLDYHIAKKMMIAHWVVEHHHVGEDISFNENYVRLCHNMNCNEIDIEMERVLNCGTQGHMDMLSKVLSNHFDKMKEHNPMMFNELVYKMKDIR